MWVDFKDNSWGENVFLSMIGKLEIIKNKIDKFNYKN